MLPPTPDQQSLSPEATTILCCGYLKKFYSSMLIPAYIYIYIFSYLHRSDCTIHNSFRELLNYYILEIFLYLHTQISLTHFNIYILYWHMDKPLFIFITICFLRNKTVYIQKFLLSPILFLLSPRGIHCPKGVVCPPCLCFYPTT